jgi:hypothetical protein
MKKQNRSKVELTCDYCSNNYSKDLSEYVRNQRLGRKSFCSRACQGKVNISNIPEDKRSTYDISKHSDNKNLDGLSFYRVMVRRARSRNKGFNLTPQYLKQVWESQNGVCIYSGVTLIKGSTDKIYMASLDRIDSSRGYVPGNVQFVSTAVNYMKSTMSHEDTLRLCEFIALYHKK